jgi:hypothetical protein
MSDGPEVMFFADLPPGQRPPTDPLPEGWAMLRANAMRTLSGRALRKRLAQLDRWEAEVPRPEQPRPKQPRSGQQRSGQQRSGQQRSGQQRSGQPRSGRRWLLG